MKETHVQVNQIEIHIREYENAGEAIIFLHFGGSNLMMWQRVTPYFEDKYHLVLIDLRGHGKSDRPETGYTIDGMASDVVGVMNHLKLEKTHILGSSIGAEIGLALAANYPEKVISLVLDGALNSEFGPYGTWEGTGQEFEEFVAARLEKIRNNPESIYSSIDALVEKQRDFFEEYGLWNEYFEAVYRYGAFKITDGKFLNGMGKKANENYTAHYLRLHFEDYYRQVNCPLLMITEKNMEEGREKTAMFGLKELTAQGEIVEINNWIHPYSWLVGPQECIQAILKFLEKVEKK